MLEFTTVLLMLVLAYVYMMEGLFTACTMFCNVMIAGVVAFNFWEPIADILGPLFKDSFLDGEEDAIVLVFLFCTVLGVLRLATNNLAKHQIEFPKAMNHGGGAVVGLITGYLLAGFLVCMLQTLPWHESFLGFKSQYKADQPMRGALPPDRVWLAMMRRASAYSFSRRADNPVAEPPSYYDTSRTFDRNGTFELRYSRYRRYSDSRDPANANKLIPLDYHGEFDRELGR